MNLILVNGNLGTNPERVGKNGAAFSLANNEKYKDQKRTNWFRIVAWNGTADAALKYLKLGDKIQVMGRMEVQKWEKDGKSGISHTVQANNIEYQRVKYFEEKVQQGNESGGNGKGSGGKKGEDDIPF